VKILYLVRHAQSQPLDALPDREWPLSDHGHGQARTLVSVLRSLDIDEVHTSPYIRCRDTIAPFVAATSVPIFEHHDLRERKVAPGIIDNFEEVWHRSWADFSFALPECETSHSTQQRVHAAVTSICEQTAATTMAINSHGNALSLLLNRADERFCVKRATAMRNPDVFRMTYADGRLAWDAEWVSPELDEFATHHDATPFPDRAKA
jgi:2,3-bisphosphoglycerate-dependent phosphoglycerate mutase